jgi:hypothetical protein
MMVMEMAVATVRTASPPGAGAADGPTSGYAPTYYPGTPSGIEAQKLTLAVGQDAQNTDFGLVPVRLVKVGGSVISSDGRPAEGVIVTATPRTMGDNPFMLGGLNSARTDKNGNFTLTGVAPGDYTLNARATQIISSSSEGGTASFTMTRMIGPGGEGGQESGSVPLSVSGEDCRTSSW